MELLMCAPQILHPLDIIEFAAMPYSVLSRCSKPVIMAGGSGTRLWPLSRELYPKQFLSLTSDRTMLQETVGRVLGIDGVEDPIVLCKEEHRFLVGEQLQQIGVKAGAIMLEPVGRNTAPAVAVAALEALEDGKDPIR